MTSAQLPNSKQINSSIKQVSPTALWVLAGGGDRMPYQFSFRTTLRQRANLKFITRNRVLKSSHLGVVAFPVKFIMICDTNSLPPEATTPLSVKRPRALSMSSQTSEPVPPPKKREAQLDCRQHRADSPISLTNLDPLSPFPSIAPARPRTNT